MVSSELHIRSLSLTLGVCAESQLSVAEVWLTGDKERLGPER